MLLTSIPCVCFFFLINLLPPTSTFLPSPVLLSAFVMFDNLLIVSRTRSTHLPCFSFRSVTLFSEMFHHRNSPSIVSQLSNVVLFITVSVLFVSIPSGVSSSSIARRQDESSSAVVHPLPTAVNPPSPSFWFGQPKSAAEQFLLSDQNDNEVIVPKWFTRLNNDEDEQDQDLFVRKRYVTMKKRKQLTKPPMEVMNEIVNSIYLKR